MEEDWTKFPNDVVCSEMEDYRRDITEKIRLKDFPIRHRIGGFNVDIALSRANRLKKELEKRGYSVEVEKDTGFYKHDPWEITLVIDN